MQARLSFNYTVAAQLHLFTMSPIILQHPSADHQFYLYALAQVLPCIIFEVVDFGIASFAHRLRPHWNGDYWVEALSHVRGSIPVCGGNATGRCFFWLDTARWNTPSTREKAAQTNIYIKHRILQTHQFRTTEYRQSHNYNPGSHTISHCQSSKITYTCR